MARSRTRWRSATRCRRSGPSWVPTRLTLHPEAGGASAPVVPVAVVGRTLTLPDDADTVGWWRGGSRVGSPFGTAVVAGHLDSVTDPAGSPRRPLGAWCPGDLVELGSEQEQVRYRVVRNDLLPSADLSSPLRPPRAAPAPPAAADHLRRSLRRWLLAATATTAWWRRCRSPAEGPGPTGRRHLDGVSKHRVEEVAVVVVGRGRGLHAPGRVGRAYVHVVARPPGPGRPGQLPAGPCATAGRRRGAARPLPGRTAVRARPRPGRSPPRRTTPARRAGWSRPATGSPPLVQHALDRHPSELGLGAVPPRRRACGTSGVFHGELTPKLRVTRSSPSHLMLAMPTQPGTTRRAGKPWSRGSGAPFISKATSTSSKALPMGERTADAPVVDPVDDVRVVQPDGHHLDRVVAQPGVVQQPGRRGARRATGPRRSPPAATGCRGAGCPAGRRRGAGRCRCTRGRSRRSRW